MLNTTRLISMAQYAASKFRVKVCKTPHESIWILEIEFLVNLWILLLSDIEFLYEHKLFARIYLDSRRFVYGNLCVNGFTPNL